MFFNFSHEIIVLTGGNNMKTTAKDVILICKGWYDKEKYPTVLEALKEYYRKNYCNDMEEHLNERFILRVILIEVMREIASKYPDRLLGFVNGYLTYGQMLFMPDENNNDYDHQLFYRIINFLARLQMRGDERIEIDTDEYFYDDYDEDGVNHKKLVEDII